MKTIEDAPFIDMFSDEFRDDAPTLLDRLRRESWVVRGAIGGLVIDRRHVQLLLADRRLRSSVVTFIEMQGVTEGLLHDRMCATLLAIEGEDHTRVRTLVRKAFVPAAVDRHRPLMGSILESLLSPVLQEAEASGQGRCDFMAAVAEHYPI